MREIKFRAWNDLDEYYGEMITEENSGLTSAQILDRFSSVMQYTGLKDRNGVEIYEGDILTFDLREWNRSSFKPESEWEKPSWVVSWDNKDAGWDTGGGLNSECSTWKEVIGNIHENAELVETPVK